MDEIAKMFEELNNRAVNTGDGNGGWVDEWFASREISYDDLHSYADTCAEKVFRDIADTSQLDMDYLAARFCAAFQLGFEVAAKRYASSGMPPTMGGDS
jgi:hypothetical protein